jgi:hypothetical protein
MPPLSNKEKRRLPIVSPPPFYNEKTTDNDHGNALPQRRMGQYGGLPQGLSRNRHGDNESADPYNEWNPGEFERSYPKNNAANAAWYKMHRYGRIPGTDVDGWRRLAGPPSPPKKAGPPSPVQKAAKTAGARAVGKGSPGRPQVDAKTTVKKGAVVAASAAKAAKKALGKLF